MSTTTSPGPAASRSACTSLTSVSKDRRAAKWSAAAVGEAKSINPFRGTGSRPAQWPDRHDPRTSRLPARLRRAREDVVQLVAQRELGAHAHQLPDHLALAEHRQRRHGHDVVGADGLRVVVGVELDEAQPVAVLGGEVVEDRVQLVAGAAPLRTEVDKHGNLAAQYLIGEGSVGDLGGHVPLLPHTSMTKFGPPGGIPGRAEIHAPISG